MTNSYDRRRDFLAKELLSTDFTREEMARSLKAFDHLDDDEVAVVLARVEALEQEQDRRTYRGPPVLITLDGAEVDELRALMGDSIRVMRWEDWSRIHKRT